MKEVVFESIDIYKKFNDLYALNGLSFKIIKGQIYGLIGEDNVGKSTLLKIICGLINPTKGYISLFGETSELNSIKKNIGFLVGEPALYPNMTALENINYYRLLCGLKKIGYDKSFPFQMPKLNKTEIVGKFSFAEKKKLAILLSLVNSPKLVILDEPFQGLDKSSAIEMISVLKNYAKDNDATMLITDKNIENVGLIATNYGFIHRGRLIKELTKEDMDALNINKVVIETHESDDRLLSLRENYNFDVSENKVIISEDKAYMEDILRVLLTNNVGISDISLTSNKFENYYLKLIEEFYE